MRLIREEENASLKVLHHNPYIIYDQAFRKRAIIFFNVTSPDLVIIYYKNYLSLYSKEYVICWKTVFIIPDNCGSENKTTAHNKNKLSYADIEQSTSTKSLFIFTSLLFRM